MTTKEFLNEFVDKTSHKIEHNVDEYDKIRNTPGVVMVKATTFYQIYKHNVFTEVDDRLTMRRFFHVCGQFFYYDKYVCEHGTEFFYYVKFNPDNEMYQLTSNIIQQRVNAHGPDKLTDLKYVMKAVTKE